MLYPEWMRSVIYLLCLLISHQETVRKLRDSLRSLKSYIMYENVWIDLSTKNNVHTLRPYCSWSNIQWIDWTHDEKRGDVERFAILLIGPDTMSARSVPLWRLFLQIVINFCASVSIRWYEYFTSRYYCFCSV